MKVVRPIRTGGEGLGKRLWRRKIRSGYHVVLANYTSGLQSGQVYQGHHDGYTKLDLQSTATDGRFRNEGGIPMAQINTSNGKWSYIHTPKGAFDPAAGI